MVIGYEWRIASKVPTTGVAESVDAVCEALTASLRALLAPQAPEVQAGVLTRSWGPLRHSMLTDGVSALREAGRWEGSAMGITVSLWAL
jgi:hypothetical protein